jgi:MFS family permease
MQLSSPDIAPPPGEAEAPKPASARPRVNPASLDWLNFLLSDTRGALGPYLNVFLVTEQHWSQSAVGAVTTVSGILGLILQTPMGAAIDRTTAKRSLVTVAIAVIALSAVAIYAAPTFWTVLFANGMMAVAGDALGPAVSAITLGVVAQQDLAHRLGRNAAFDHAENVAIAVVAGGMGWALGQRAVFLLVPFFAALAASVVFTIPAHAIDHDRARGGALDGSEASWWRTLRDNPLLLTYGCCAMLFHFANAPLLPLVGQKLAFANKEFATAMMSTCIIGAQAVMLPVALFVGKTADRIGRKPLLIAAFVILPIRAVLYTASNDPYWLIGVQLLDGIGAGIFGAVTPLLLADVMRGTGRYNLAQGAVATMQGVGASLSGLVAGLVVDRFGYNAAFVTLGIVALAALLLLSTSMPETAGDRVQSAT